MVTKNEAERREQNQQRKRDLENAEQAIRNMGVEGFVSADSLADNFEPGALRGSTAELAAADRTWAFGHIVVDEAQELSPMQWRLLQRRGPQKSFTIVGDVAQASAAAGATTWSEALASFGRDNWRMEELTVNYRTPAQIAAVAESMALAHGLAITRSSAVRDSEWPVAVHRSEDSAATLLEVLEADRAIDPSGTIAVIASASQIDALFTQLSPSLGDTAGRGPAGLVRPMAFMTPADAKGLEFDTAVVVEPSLIVSEIERGAAALYVSLTRPTQRLHLVTTTELPRGIEQ